MFFFFFFKQKTAYEIYQCDWSSDVCSSDLFQKITSISIEPIYTGKLLFGVYNLILNHYFSNGKTILAIHTGGLQGLKGMKKKVLKIGDANYDDL